MVVLRDYNSFQIMSLLIISVIFQCMAIMGKPMNERSENRMVVFNEIMVSCYLYTMIPLTNINPSDEIKNSCGIALVSIVMLSIFVNFFKFFKNVC